MATFNGSFILVLHAHMPWVMYHDGLEVEWLYEACAETYIPVLKALCRLVDEGVSPCITITMSPVLAEQLALDDFKSGFVAYCEKKIEYAKRDQVDLGSHDAHLKYLAERWEKFYRETERSFVEDFGRDILGAFGRLQRERAIELMTVGATHAYFPAACEDTSIQAQVRMAVRSHERHFGARPRGLWLPECGYRPACKWAPRVGAHYGETPYPRKGVEEFLSEAELNYFIVDNHQLMRAHPPERNKNPFYAHWARGAYTPREPVAVLARDIDVSLQVWRHEIGYPGDGVYLDFHKKHSEGRLRYWKITHNKADMAFKHFYYPEDAVNQKVLEHAGHYKLLIANSIKAHREMSGDAAMCMAAFDAELYGHWWFEGPLFLYHLIKWIHQDPEIRTETCSEFLYRTPPKDDVFLPESSWGNQFDSSTWINEEVAWALDKEYDAEREMRDLAREFGHRDDPELRKMLAQCARELMVLMSSDWKFMITNWSTRDHAERRVTEHYNDFKRLAIMARDYGHGQVIDQDEWLFLGDTMARNRLFPDIEPLWFADLEFPAM